MAWNASWIIPVGPTVTHPCFGFMTQTSPPARTHPIRAHHRPPPSSSTATATASLSLSLEYLMLSASILELTTAIASLLFSVFSASVIRASAQ
ncbi:hypothetical protein CRG98_002411, partial [Punica granatum]